MRRMLLNNLVSAGVGYVSLLGECQNQPTATVFGRLIPLVGDVILATFKANSRNAALLEEYLRIRGEEYLKVCRHPSNRVDRNSYRCNQVVAKLPQDPTVSKPDVGRDPGEVVPSKRFGAITKFFGSRKEDVS